MEVKTYRVRSVAEALPLIARELGPDAAVLHTRQLPKRWHQWLGGPQWEVVAGLDPAVPDRFSASWRAPDPLSSLAPGSTLESPLEPQLEPQLESRFESLRGLPTAVPRQTFFEPSGGRGPAYRDESPSGAGSEPSIAAAVHQRWQALQIDPETIDRMWQDLDLSSLDHASRGDDGAWLQLRQRFAEVISLPGELPPATGRCRRAALVGPTGVGKTTTVAKLAADFQLRQGCQVGLITVDTFRVGAVEQLQAYAEILDVPMRVVSDGEQMRVATRELSHCDWVLIDTIGRSPRDLRRIESLQHILQAADLDHLFLTLSASSDPRTMAAALRGFSGPNLARETALILTKIDECQTLAPLYPLLRDSGLPWRYWTHGQNVPEDLGVAADDVVAWFLDEVQWTEQPT